MRELVTENYIFMKISVNLSFTTIILQLHILHPTRTHVHTHTDKFFSLCFIHTGYILTNTKRPEKQEFYLPTRTACSLMGFLSFNESELLNNAKNISPFHSLSSAFVVRLTGRFKKGHVLYLLEIKKSYWKICSFKTQNNTTSQILYRVPCICDTFRTSAILRSFSQTEN